MKKLVTVALLSAFVGTAGGCLVISGKSIEEQGALVSPQTLQQIEHGVTTEPWLLAVLGDPTDVRVVEGCPGQKILRYDHTIRKAEGGAVFLIFAGGSETSSTKSVYFETTDGVVTRHWTEP